MTDRRRGRDGTTVNGVAHPEAVGTTVDALVGDWCPSPRGVAVAVDGTVVPRSEWASTVIGPGSAVEIVTAAAGG